MLNENQIVDIVCNYLSQTGYEVERSSTTYDKGYDIVASNPKGVKLIIEAKGATSSKPSSKRYNKEFDRKQVVNHVSRALYSTIKVINKYPKYEVGIALPHNDFHIKAIKDIQNVVDLLKIKVYWVTENRDVIVYEEVIG